MTRALFVTVASNELYMPVNAWRNTMGLAAHITYNANGPRNDDGIIACAKGYRPDVIFYIGSNTGGGLPSVGTLRKLRDFAPCIHYQSDVEDEAWHDLLRQYRREGCFDLIVGQTGVKTDLIDMASLMAIDIDAFNGPMPKTTLCGFSGSLAGARWDMLGRLVNQVSIRAHEPVGDYRSYVDFLKRCLIAINVSYTGSERRHHVKWRVLEAAFAGCVLLEMKDSPTSDWFPPGTYLSYSTAGEAKRLIQNSRVRDLKRMADAFSAYAREHYTPRQIYTSILEAL